MVFMLKMYNLKILKQWFYFEYNNCHPHQNLNVEKQIHLISTFNGLSGALTRHLIHIFPDCDVANIWYLTAIDRGVPFFST